MRARRPGAPTWLGCGPRTPACPGLPLRPPFFPALSWFALRGPSPRALESRRLCPATRTPSGPLRLRSSAPLRALASELRAALPPPRSPPLRSVTPSPQLAPPPLPRGAFLAGRWAGRSLAPCLLQGHGSSWASSATGSAQRGGGAGVRVPGRSGPPRRQPGLSCGAGHRGAAEGGRGLGTPTRLSGPLQEAPRVGPGESRGVPSRAA